MTVFQKGIVLPNILDTMPMALSSWQFSSLFCSSTVIFELTATKERENLAKWKSFYGWVAICKFYLTEF